jgi:hypothetical protein
MVNLPQKMVNLIQNNQSDVKMCREFRLNDLFVLIADE